MTKWWLPFFTANFWLPTFSLFRSVDYKKSMTNYKEKCLFCLGCYFDNQTFTKFEFESVTLGAVHN